MAIKLVYFDINGLAEAVRYMLHYRHIDFEDLRYDYQKWPIKDVKEALPYGQLPIYQEGERVLNQSLAIARYVGHKANLVPEDPWEQATLDAAAMNIYDYWNKAVLHIREPEIVRKNHLKNIFLNETLDFYYSRFEKELKANNGYFNGKLSWVDFFFIGIVETMNLVNNANLDEKYPNILALKTNIRSLDGVKRYIASRKPYVF